MVLVNDTSAIEFDRGESSPPQLVDPFQRAITYLRVSVTDRCDFRCVYCMSEHMTFLPKSDLLSLEELDRLCRRIRGKRRQQVAPDRWGAAGPPWHHDIGVFASLAILPAARSRN
jgi:hypothetical protein